MTDTFTVMDVAALTDDEQVELILDMHRSPIAQQVRRQRADALDDARTWVDPNGYRLSDRLWNQRQAVREQIDGILRAGIASGADSNDVARAVERYLHPSYRPTRTTNGRIVRDKRKQVVTTKARGGAGSYPARRLARTEITRAHGQAVDVAVRALGIDVEWALANSHPKADICDGYASGSSAGKPSGVYLVDDHPPYPAHPHCLCALSPYDDRTPDEVVAYLRKAYRLDEP